MNNTNTYTVASFANIVGVSKTSINHYMTILEESGYFVARNARKHRIYTDNDIEVVNLLLALNRDRGLRLKEAAQLAINPDFDMKALPVVVTTVPTVVAESGYEDLSRSMQLLATHVHGIEQQNAQLLELIQAQRQQNELLMAQNDTLKQELGTMMTHLFEKANEPQLLSQQQLNRVEQQNSAIMNVLNRLQTEKNEEAPSQVTEQKGLFGKFRGR